MTPAQRKAVAIVLTHYENDPRMDCLRELLAEPQGEPVAWCSLTPSGTIAYFDGKPMVMPGAVGNEVHRTPLYTHPPQQRKPRTDERIVAIANSCLDSFDDDCAQNLTTTFARAIERAITGEPT